MKGKFTGIKKMLSRDEMRQIKGASGGGGGFTCPSGTPVYYCTEAGYSPWTTEWCCGPGPRYSGNATCTLIGYTPGTTSNNVC